MEYWSDGVLGKTEETSGEWQRRLIDEKQYDDCYRPHMTNRGGQHGNNKVLNTDGLIEGGFDPAAVVKDAIESKKLCLQLVLQKSEVAVKSFETKYSRPSTDIADGLTVDDLDSHEDYIAWIGELHIRDRIISELETLGEIVYDQ